MRILLTGASGFIGGHTMTFLKNQGHCVYPVSRKLKKNWIQMNLREKESFQNLPDVDVVVHTAGVLGGWNVTKKELWDTHVQAFDFLFQAYQKRLPPLWIILSAGGVTGPTGKTPANETFPCRPFSEYQKSKLAGEKKALDLSKKNNVQMLIFRPTWTYGPGDRHKLALFKAIQKGYFFTVSKGLGMVHPIFVQDVAAAISQAIQNPPPTDIYNLCGPNPASWAEISKILRKQLNQNAFKINFPFPLAFSLAIAMEGVGKSGICSPPWNRSRLEMFTKDYVYCGDKITQALKPYHPKTDFKDGLKETAIWYQQKGWL